MWNALLFLAVGGKAGRDTLGLGGGAQETQIPDMRGWHPKPQILNPEPVRSLSTYRLHCSSAFGGVPYRILQIRLVNQKKELIAMDTIGKP